MKEYKCSLDNMARFIPWFILILAIAVTKQLYITMPPFVNRGIPLPYFAPALLIVVFIITYLLKPLSINVYDSNITIHRRVSPVTIPFSDIRAISKVENMGFAFRTFGNGGMFGYTGKYYNAGLGRMTWYCTQRRNYILVEKTDGKKIVFTPDDPDSFMHDLALKHPSLQLFREVQ